MSNITKSNILLYITNLLLESEYYIRFHSNKHEKQFINYIWKSYQEYIMFTNTKNICEKNDYKEKYIGFDDIFKYELDNNELMNKCLFIHATEYSCRNNLPKIINLDVDDSKIHWLIRIGDGKNFKNSSNFNIWGVKETTSTKHFEKIVKKGDILWFVVSHNNGQAISFSEYISHNERTRTNKELAWENANNSNNWTIEINYKNLTNIENENYFTNIKGQNVNIRKYNDKCKINLPQIYKKTKVV